MDLQHLRASDGTGEAVLAHVQSIRTIGSTVLDLDNIDNWNSKCVVVTGTPNANGYIDSAGMTVMYGHTNAGDFIIDGYAPGYTDQGNTTTQVAIIKMTTNWADALVDILKVAHNDNGTIKNDAITTKDQFVDALDPVLRASELVFDHVASGLVWSGDSYGSTRAASMTAGVVYIGGIRVPVSAITARTFTASKDTYIDVGTDGVIDYTEVANNAASPALAASHVRIGIIITGAGSIANVGAINQGQKGKLLPIASSIPYMVTDSLGNLICSRNPLRKTLGYRETYTLFTTTSTSNVAITGIGCTFKVPAGRKYRAELYCYDLSNNTNGAFAQMAICLTSASDANRIQIANSRVVGGQGNNSQHLIYYGENDTASEATVTLVPSAAAASGGGTVTVGAAANVAPIVFLIEIE